MPDLPTKVKVKSRGQQWQEDNRERYNARQREYMRRYRARKKAERDQQEKGE